MTYLYGDSTPASVQTNFLEFVRDAMASLADAAKASAAIVDQAQLADACRRDADEDLRRLDALDALVKRAIAGAPSVPRDSPAARCARVIIDRSTDLVLAERDGVEARVAQEIARGEGDVSTQRSNAFRALEALLARHDLPESRSTVVMRAPSDNGAFGATIAASTPYGITSNIELDVPAGHLYAQPLRIDRVAEKLDVHAPEMSGWLQKSIKLKPQRLDRYHLIELVAAPSETRIKLRLGPDGTGDGFDIVARGTKLSLTRSGEQGDVVGDPTEPEDKEAEALGALVEKLRTAALDLRDLRKRLTDARLDGDSIHSLEDPIALVDRLVAAVAPTVRDIARHSLSNDELVLKRMLAGGKREEFFVSKRELLDVLDDVPASRRHHFAPLGLDEALAASIPPPAWSATSSSPSTGATASSPPALATASSPPASATASAPPTQSRPMLIPVEERPLRSDDAAELEFTRVEIPVEEEEEVTVEFSVSGIDVLPFLPPVEEPAAPVSEPRLAAPAVPAPPVGKPSSPAIPRPSIPPGPPRPRAKG